MTDCHRASNGFSKIQKLQRGLYLSAKRDGQRKFYSLYDKIYRKDILWAAWNQVKSNRGSAGIDGETIKQIIDEHREESMIDEITTLLKEKNYRLKPVKEILIPKRQGGTRPLGIATIRDRVVQTAMKIVIEPIFEADFHDCSYGYRPKRGAWKATHEIRNDLYNRAWGVIEVDLKSYFTRVVHWKLQKLIEKRICDKAMLMLIKQSMKVPVRRGKQIETTKIGVPQGSPLSPLLSNIYLNVLDQLWDKYECPDKLGAKLHRYADDIVIVCQRSEYPVKQTLDRILARLDLEVNQNKTKTTSIKDGFNFVGFEFVKRKSPSHGRSVIYLFPSKPSQAEIRKRIRKVSSRKAPILPDEFIKQINSIVRGWAEYYRYTNGAQSLRKLQYFVENRVRRFLCYRKKMRHVSFKDFPRERIYKMGLIQIHSGWIKPEGPFGACR